METRAASIATLPAPTTQTLWKCFYRRIVIIAVSLHEVYTGKKLVCRVNAEEVLAGDVQELGQACAGADEHCLIAVLEQLVNGLALADDCVVYDLNAHGLEVLDLGCNDLLGQTELGDTIDQNAAGLVECLKDGNVVAHLAQVACTGEAGRAGADDRDAVTVGFGSLDLVLDFPCSCGSRRQSARGGRCQRSRP